MSDAQSGVLPLIEAYDFAREHGLGDRADQIKRMNIPGAQYSTVRRGYIFELLSEHGLFDQFKARYWSRGNSSAGATEIRRYLREKQKYEASLGGNNEVANDIAYPADTEEEIYEQAFAAEADLRDFLANNPNCIEKDLRIYEADGARGVEFQIDEGRIDLLAVDTQDRFVVIELKLGRGRNRALGQILYYMSWVDRNLSKAPPCRGIIVAKDIRPDLVLAVERAPGVALYSYKLSMTLFPVTSATERP